MATDLEVFGPFEIPVDRQKRIDDEQGRAFWKNAAVHDLRDKQGCYFFAFRAGRGFAPWYVGKASKGFEQETFSDNKLKLYGRAIARAGKGTPVLFFVAPQGAKKKIPTSELNDLERQMIQDALAENEALCNTQHTKNLPRWSIKGVVRAGRGKPTAQAKAFRTMMGL